MSLNRLIYYGAIIGGWSAFVGWLLAEILFLRGSTADPGLGLVLLIGAVVGAGVGGGLSMLAGMVSGGWAGLAKRAGPGLLGGFLGGLVGGLLGDGLFRLLGGGIVAYAIGWTLLGLAIGAVDGIYEQSLRRLRNGLIGGAIGGMVGGLLFLPVTQGMGGSMAGRAVSFVILGLCVGLFISLVQVVLKDAWLTVVEGYRPGRQMILTQPEIFMGTAEQVALNFIAFGARGVEPRHVRIIRQPDGSFVCYDNNTRNGTQVNGHPLTAPVLLRDGDVISFGVNKVRFSERRRAAGVAAPVPVMPAAPARPSAPVVTPVGIQAGYLTAPQAPQAPQAPMPQAVRPVAPTAPPYPPQPIPVQPPVAPRPPVTQPPAGQRPPVAPQQPAAPRPPAPPPAAAPRPPMQQPPTAPRPPAAQQPPGAPRPPAAQQPPAASRPAPAEPCPNCGMRVPGTPGKRVCKICQTVF